MCRIFFKPGQFTVYTALPGQCHLCCSQITFTEKFPIACSKTCKSYDGFALRLFFIFFGGGGGRGIMGASLNITIPSILSPATGNKGSLWWGDLKVTRVSKIFHWTLDLRVFNIPLYYITNMTTLRVPLPS